MHRYQGAWPTMVTPYNHDLKLDHGAYRALVEWYIGHGVGGLYANCLTSEMYCLNDEERLLLVREAVEVAGGRVPVAATGNLGETLAEHIALCRRVAAAGADVVMLLVPVFHNDDAALEDYYLTMAEQVDAPLGLYECPVPRRYHLGLDLVRRLAQTGRFVAYKETSCDLAKIKGLLEVTAGTSLALLQANTPYLLHFVRAGGLGIMSTASAWVPDLVAAVIDRGRAGAPGAERLQEELCVLHLVERLAHPQGTQYLLQKRGLPITPRSRQPGSPLTPEVVQGLDYCAAHWFDRQGNLIALKSS